MNTWVDLGILNNFPKRLQKYYLTRQQEVRTRLGLSYPLFTSSEADKAWHELHLHELLFKEIGSWLEAKQLRSGFLPVDYARLIELQNRLAGHNKPQMVATNSSRLEEINFLLRAIARLDQRDDFITTEARRRIISPLLSEKEALEKSLLPPVKIKTEKQPKKEEAVTPPIAQPAPVVPVAPRPPLRERLWRSILSERTLQALLFLGIFLLFVAAISFVVWGWKDFPAPVRVAIPFGFTTLFFILGQVVRAKTHLDRSALALSAIAALLIPINSYTIYANYGSPPDGWPEFWLITSLACLIAYILAALQIQSRFFGYITGIAAGSVLLSILEVTTDISRDWYSATISVLAVGLIVLSTKDLASFQPRTLARLLRSFSLPGALDSRRSHAADIGIKTSSRAIPLTPCITQ